MNILFRRLRPMAMGAALMLGWLGAGFSAEEPLPEGAASPAPATAPTNNTPDALAASYLQLQEQLHAAKLAFEQQRQESEAAAKREAEALEARLRGIELSVTAQRSTELEELRGINRLLMIMVGTFGAIAFLAFVFMADFQWRMVSRLAEISAAIPARQMLLPAQAGAASAGDTALVPGAAGYDASLPGMIERIEKRIHELELAAHQPINVESSADAHGAENGAANAHGAGNGAPRMDQSRVAGLMGKGQSLLDLKQAEEALTCFEEVLALEPNHLEARLKKGNALEQTGRLEEALECFDEVIARDASTSLAYLYKAGICNRLERFQDALDCYNMALQAQGKRTP